MRRTGEKPNIGQTGKLETNSKSVVKIITKRSAINERAV